MENKKRNFFIFNCWRYDVKDSNSLVFSIFPYTRFHCGLWIRWAIDKKRWKKYGKDVISYGMGKIVFAGSEDKVFYICIGKFLIYFLSPKYLYRNSVKR